MPDTLTTPLPVVPRFSSVKSWLLSATLVLTATCALAQEAVLPWHLQAAPGINVAPAWEITRGEGAHIAIIDDGFYLKNPFFQGADIQPVQNYTLKGLARTTPWKDDHGTQVLGVIAGQGEEVQGIAPDATIHPFRVNIATHGIFPPDYMPVFEAAAKQASIVNFSIENGPIAERNLKCNQPLMKRMAELSETGGPDGLGVVFVVAAGNAAMPLDLAAADNKNGLLFKGADPATGKSALQKSPPGTEVMHNRYAHLPNVVVVAAHNHQGQRSPFSNWGGLVTVSAPSGDGSYPLASFSKAYEIKNPGPEITTTRVSLERPDDPKTPLDERFVTDSFSGTSASAPETTATLGLIKAAYPEATAKQLVDILTKTAHKNLLPTTAHFPYDLNLQGLDGAFKVQTNAQTKSLFYGYGGVDAGAAVQEAKRRQALAR